MTEPTRPPPRAAEPREEPPLQRMATQIDRETPDGAAFLDGLSDEDLALFAESLAIQRELEEEDARIAASRAPSAPPVLRVVMAEPAAVDEPIPGVVPIGRARRKPVSPAWRMLAAAAVVLVVVTPFLTRSGGARVREPSDAVAMLPQDARLPNATLSLGGTRSGNDAGGEMAVRSARIGAYLVELQLAIRDGNAERTRQLARDAGEEVAGLGNAGPEAADAFQQIEQGAGGEPGPLLAQLATATDIAQDDVDDDYFALGAWAGAARIAAYSGDAEFFRSDRTRGTLRRAEKVLRGNQQAQAALTRINALLALEHWDPAEMGQTIQNLLIPIAK